MFDLGWTELLLIAVVTLIVVGPKDLPGMFRQLGRATARIRGMAREFQRAMEDAADESGVKDVSKDLRNISNPRKMGMDSLKDATKDLSGWKPDTSKPGAKAAKAGDTSAKKSATAKTGESASESTSRQGNASEKKAAPGTETEKLSQKRADDAEKARSEAAARRTAKAREEAPAGDDAPARDGSKDSVADASGSGDEPKTSAKGNS